MSNGGLSRRVPKSNRNHSLWNKTVVVRTFGWRNIEIWPRKPSVASFIAEQSSTATWCVFVLNHFFFWSSFFSHSFHTWTMLSLMIFFHSWGSKSPWREISALGANGEMIRIMIRISNERVGLVSWRYFCQKHFSHLKSLNVSWTSIPQNSLQVVSFANPFQKFVTVSPKDNRQLTRFISCLRTIH